ncbi:MAG: AraC family transcriptional regulator [Alphaproteobacteria bacterium]|nr:AraC family transcriptional regulator [Alphaproteobacteria bacterium]
MSIPAHPTARLHAVLNGRCLVRIDQGPWQELAQGDVVLIPQGNGHDLASRPGTRLRPLAEYPRRAIDDQTYAMRITGAGDAHSTLSCSEFELADDASMLLRLFLPPLVIVRGHMGRDPMFPLLLKAMAEEIGQARLARGTVLRRLADLLLAKLLEVCVDDPGVADQAGLVLQDRRVARALDELMRQPPVQWSVANLALHAGLARATLTGRMLRTVGMSPSGFLRKFKLARASHAVRFSGEALENVAEAAGYGSAASFSRAYRAHSEGLPGPIAAQPAGGPADAVRGWRNHDPLFLAWLPA